MASVAICPHCYLQLIVPDGIERDEPVECPTCAKDFDLSQAVLRAIPEVARRKQGPSPASDDAVLTSNHAINDIVAAAAKSAAEQETHFVEEVKTRIEAELASGRLQPGTETTLWLDSAVVESDIQDASATESTRGDFAEWFRANEVPSDASVEDDASEDLMLDSELELESDLKLSTAAGDGEMTPRTDESTEVEEAAENAAAESAIEGAPAEDAEVQYGIEAVVDRIDAASGIPEVIEPTFARPSATTLADLLPPKEPAQPIEPALGPSFELPNVPLTPNNGATIEIDPSMTFGPAAETEFELENVDFAATPGEDFTEDLSTEENEPVFSEPSAITAATAPIVLPGIPRVRKKRSVARTLVGTALGGIIGLTIGYFVLLYMLGPDGDLLQVAKYLPDAVLPSSLKSAPAQQVVQNSVTPPPVGATSSPTTDESANVPAGYVEEVPTTDEPLASDETTTGDHYNSDRYAIEPSPLDEPPAQPITGGAGGAIVAPLPFRGPTYTVDQLAIALEAAEEASTSLVGGNLSDAVVRRKKGMSYETFCNLANALTFVDRASSSVESEQAIETADRLFRETLAEPRTQNEVSLIAGIWVDSPHRKHSGIFLAGTVSGGRIAGDVYEYQLTTADRSQWTILRSEPLDPLAEGSSVPVAIVGAIVDEPAEQISGYNGGAKRAIWATRAIPLD